MTFRFLEETHEYFLADTPIRSVTQVLADVGMVDYRFGNENAALRGTYVHRATEMIDKGTLDWEGLDDILRPYCEAYRKWKEEAHPEIILSEKPMYHAKYLYAGTLDRVIRLNGSLVLIDIKTGVPSAATSVQVAAYIELARVNEDMHIFKGYVLHLRDDGTYRVNEVKDLKKQFQIFLAALTVARWRREHVV